MILPHMCVTGHIPKPGAPNNLVGHQVQIVHACHTYIQCALHKVLGISPTGTKFLKQYYLFFLIKHLKPNYNI